MLISLSKQPDFEKIKKTEDGQVLSIIFDEIKNHLQEIFPGDRFLIRGYDGFDCTVPFGAIRLYKMVGSGKILGIFKKYSAPAVIFETSFVVHRTKNSGNVIFMEIHDSAIEEHVINLFRRSMELVGIDCICLTRKYEGHYEEKEAITAY